ncbi:MAG TPA: response regulator transcription factor [Iamia sp.]
MRVLVVEDDPAALREHVRALRRLGLAVDGERTVRAGGRALADVPYDALVVRRRLADGDGMALAHELGDHVAVVVLTSGPVGERLDLLLAGVDDCIAPPVGTQELALRLGKAMLRRTGSPSRVRIGRVLVDRIRREVSLDGAPVALTARQMCVLDHLVAHRHRVVSLEELLEHCWDERSDMFSNPVPSQITRLRSKLAGAIDIVWTGGAGYLLHVVEEEPTSARGEPDACGGTRPWL